MDRNGFLPYAAERVRKAHPHLTAKQSVAVAERIAHQEDQSVLPLWAYSEATASTRDVLIDRAIEVAHEQAPVLFRPAPTREQYIELQAREFAAKMGRPWSAIDRMNAHRAAADLSPDDLLARVPADAALPEPREPANQISKAPGAKADDDWRGLDEMIRERGLDPMQLSARTRLEMHRRLKREAEVQERIEKNDAAALKAVGDDMSKLPPAVRMAKFRAAEAAKAKNRA
jgi:hypothetical protein